MTEFNAQPTLIGETIILRPVSTDDWEALYAVARDPLIWEVHPAHDRWKEDVYRAYFDQGLASCGALIVTDRVSGAIIGSSRYSSEFAEAGEIEIGWTFLDRTYWGGQTNYEMKAMMIGHALNYYDQVIFRVGETNGRSRRAMEKIGGRLLDRFQLSMMAGKEVRHVVYAIDRATFVRVFA
jgi:N-acetyltransferase